MARNWFRKLIARPAARVHSPRTRIGLDILEDRTVPASAITSLAPLTVPSTALVGGSLAASTTLTQIEAPVGVVSGATISFQMAGAESAMAIGTTNSAGLATGTFTPSMRGVHTVSASYAGSSVLLPAMSNLATVKVYQSTHLVIAAPVSAICGQPVTVSATLTALPGGGPLANQFITFSYNNGLSQFLATTDAQGMANVSVDFTTTGPLTVAASFSNEADFFTDHTGAFPVVAEVAAAPVTVVRANTSLAAVTVPATALIGNSVTASTTLTRVDAPAGAVSDATVSFQMAGPDVRMAIGSTDSAGVATGSFSPSARGVYHINASYAGNSVLNPATSNLAPVTVYQPTSLAFAGPVTGIAGQSVTVSATLTKLPGGGPLPDQTISFSFSGGVASQSATTAANGVASVNVIFPSSGTFAVTASFSNAADFFADHTGVFPVVAETTSASALVANASTSLAGLTAPATALVGNSLMASTTLTRVDAPAGAVSGASVSFQMAGAESATASGTTTSTGLATGSFSPMVRGVHTIRASYAGSSVLNPATSNLTTVTVYQPTSLALAGPVTGIAGQSVTVSATLTTFPGGASLAGQTISFSFGGGVASQSATTAANGVAGVNVIFPSSGTFSVTASFSNAADFFTNHTGAVPAVGETASVSVIVANAPTALALAVSMPTTVPYLPVTFTATLPVGTVGTVAFNDGSTLLGTSSISGGVASLTTTFDRTGTHGISASFTGAPTATVSVSVVQATLLPDPINPGKSALFVGGTAAIDLIGVDRGSNDQYTVGIVSFPVGQWPTSWSKTFSGPLSRVVVYGGDGNDGIGVDNNLNADAWLYGGNGNDALVGGGGNDLLMGGAGDDILTASGGRDVLIGGIGADTLIGASGGELLIAGTTAFDLNEAALRAVQQEWTSSRDLATRVANLRGTGSGTKANGGTFLKASGAGATVFNDTSADTLTGGSGSDWFIANTSGSGVLDTLYAKKSDDLLDDLS